MNDGIQISNTTAGPEFLKFVIRVSFDIRHSDFGIAFAFLFRFGLNNSNCGSLKKS